MPHPKRLFHHQLEDRKVPNFQPVTLPHKLPMEPCPPTPNHFTLTAHMAAHNRRAVTPTPRHLLGSRGWWDERRDSSYLHVYRGPCIVGCVWGPVPHQTLCGTSLYFLSGRSHAHSEHCLVALKCLPGLIVTRPQTACSGPLHLSGSK